MIRQRDDSGLYMIGEGAGMGKAGSNAITNSDKLEFAVFVLNTLLCIWGYPRRRCMTL